MFSKSPICTYFDPLLPSTEYGSYFCNDNLHHGRRASAARTIVSVYAQFTDKNTKDFGEDRSDVVDRNAMVENLFVEQHSNSGESIQSCDRMLVPSKQQQEGCMAFVGGGGLNSSANNLIV